MPHLFGILISFT